MGNPLLYYLINQIDARSSVTNYDYALIVCSFIAMSNPEYRCSVCKNRFGRDHKKQKEHQARKGCFGPISTGMFYRGDGPMKGYARLEFKRCFTIYHNPGTADLINTITQVSTGFHEPAKIADLRDLVDNLIAEKQEETQRTKERLTRGKSRY